MSDPTTILSSNVYFIFREWLEKPWKVLSQFPAHSGSISTMQSIWVMSGMMMVALLRRITIYLWAFKEVSLTLAKQEVCQRDQHTSMTVASLENRPYGGSQVMPPLARRPGPGTAWRGTRGRGTVRTRATGTPKWRGQPPIYVGLVARLLANHLNIYLLL